MRQAELVKARFVTLDVSEKRAIPCVGLFDMAASDAATLRSCGYCRQSQ
jgi:hypothetical protein